MNREMDSYTYLRTLMVEHFDVPEESISPNARLFDDLGIDSIDAVDMIVFMREKTGERIAPERFKSVKTVQDIVNIMDTMMN